MINMGALQVEWAHIKAFGAKKAILLAVLIDIDGDQKRHGNTKPFPCKIDSLEKLLNYNRKTIIAYLKTLRELNILKAYKQRGEMDNTNYYEINYDALNNSIKEML